MAETGILTQTMLQLIDDGLWESPWHTIAEATSELSDEDLDYQPVAGVTGHWMSDMARPASYGARAIIRHLVGSTLEAAEALPEPPGEVAARWDDVEPFDWEAGVSTLMPVIDLAHKVARERVTALCDGRLYEESTASGGLSGFSSMEVAIQCFVLHPHWHLGQLALIPKWRRMGEGAPPVPVAPHPGESLTPCGDWPFRIPQVSTRRDLLLEVLRQAQEACPWHAFERTISGLSDSEATWLPHAATGEDRTPPILDLCLHVASCDVVYADMAFGQHRSDWGWAARSVGADAGLAPAGACAAMSRQGHEFLVGMTGGVSEEQIDAVYLMHHGHQMTGWQVIACMIQHRLWHAGQIAMVRDAYAGR